MITTATYHTETTKAKRLLAAKVVRLFFATRVKCPQSRNRARHMIARSLFDSASAARIGPRMRKNFSNYLDR
jgi:hypothetical protein